MIKHIESKLNKINCRINFLNIHFITLSDNSFEIFDELLSVQEVLLVNFVLQTVTTKQLKISLIGTLLRLFSSC